MALAQLLSHAALEDRLKVVANAASARGASCPGGSRRAAGRPAAARRLHAESLLARGFLERALSRTEQTALAPAPLLVQFRCAVARVWQRPPTARPKTSTALTSSSQPRPPSFSSSSSSSPPSSLRDDNDCTQSPAAQRLLLSHLVASQHALPAPTLAPAAPPARCLVGSLTDPRSGRTFDIVCCHDKSTALAALSILLTEGNAHRKRGRKVGYLLAGVDDDGGLALRGLHIAEASRGQGLSKLLLSCWLLLCFKLGVHPRTRTMDKPLVALALQSLGFEPVRTTWPVEVAGLPLLSAGKASSSSASSSSSCTAGRALIWAENLQRLRSLFSKNVCRTQRIEISEVRPAQSRRTFVRTAFAAPDNLAALRARLHTRLGGHHVFFAARLVAFACTFAGLRARLLAAYEETA